MIDDKKIEEEMIRGLDEPVRVPDVTDEVELIGAIANTTTAIKIDGGGGGGKVLLEFAETEMPQLLKLTCLRQILLRVIVQPIDNPIVGKG